jgi:signal transduction histidine kinase
LTGRRRHLVALAGMVLVPLGLLAAAGARLVEREQRLVRQTFEELAMAQLADMAQTVRGLVEERERRFVEVPELLEAGGDATERLRRVVRREPLFRAALVLDRDGRLLHPPSTGERTEQERAFLLRARALLADRGALLARADAETEGRAQPRDVAGKTRSASRTAPAVPMRERGWRVWYEGADLDLLLWQRAVDGRVVGVEVDRARLLADVIGRLPEAASAGRSFALLDARGEVLHRWGGYEPRAGEAAVARLALARPLAAWQLVAYASASSWGRGQRGLWVALAVGLASFALALTGLAVFLYREHTRGLCLAEQRVSFVNRVSHELKTPLTNIRLYAELLEERLDDADEEARRQIQIVVAEGQRLGRLIDNVLTFGRQQRGALGLRASRGVVDTVVARALERLTPSLAARGIRIETQLGAPAEVQLDGDALTQILENLLSNVEKYAAAGGMVRVETRQDGERTTLTVSDYGPGIALGARERVFEPFERLGDGVTETAQGTGIGLTIVRELARLHGGEAVVLDTREGAAFEITLLTPGAPDMSGAPA